MSAASVTLHQSSEQEPGTISWDSGLDLPIEAEIPFDSMLAGTGWYPSEIFEGVCFRWMGSKPTARVFAVLDRAVDLELSVYVPHIADHAYWEAVTFSVDGHPVAATLTADEVRRYVISLPARAPRSADPTGTEPRDLAESLTEIEVCAPFAKQPNPSDARTLSIGVSLLRVRPVAPEVLARNRLIVRAALLSYFAGRDVAGLIPASDGPGATS
ncbi:hypothetical protein GOFOIKOB_5695 [Methylobacterium tardum]|uniref:Uncharacterized protein n=1 Tax=Methylobacterium tardum TaxID=374432 RepID=A0AA37TAQ3_9HYPH|nr:hypothetical protein [Methylobacterium tardum]URD37917.1 hypothetical protein M6G65_05230 [Methylobacterium tardum]GJE52622.1 hypothetical protein GOFOIKOB_5695 [Methylobacterium tardum]GLS69906.1 hypothetical protein GCM10007890_19190 [Methylobacterium tardum]